LAVSNSSAVITGGKLKVEESVDGKMKTGDERSTGNAFEVYHNVTFCPLSAKLMGTLEAIQTLKFVLL
jgi:hypothetical protein